MHVFQSHMLLLYSVLLLLSTILVPQARLELARISPLVPKTSVSAIPPPGLYSLAAFKQYIKYSSSVIHIYIY